jgi:exopolyphosphatase / guanosine-5'-triphosphate,3'-diphosphate pyrophosphatase
VIGQGEVIDFEDSLQMGAVRLYRNMPIRNVEEAFAVVSRAGEILAPRKKEILALTPPVEWVGVGGTFTTAAALAQNIHWNERSHIAGFPLKRPEVERILTLLAPMPLEVRTTLPGIQPQRADIIAHGMAILLCCMNELNIPQMIVSESGNLEGYLKRTYL